MKRKIADVLDTLTDTYVPDKLDAVMKLTANMPQVSYVAEARPQTQAPVLWRKVLAPAVCCCLIALLGFGVWRSSMLTPAPLSPDTPAIVPSSPDEIAPEAPVVLETADGGGAQEVPAIPSTDEVLPVPEADQIVINQLETAPATVEQDVQRNGYGKIPYDVWEDIMARFQAKTGIEYHAFCARIPAEFQDNYNFFTLSLRGYKDFGRDEDYLLHDYVFECYNSAGAKAIIALCDFESPLQGAGISEQDLVESQINGTPVTICSYGDTYWAQYSYQGVNYTIETTGLDQAGLEALLTSLLTA